MAIAGMMYLSFAFTSGIPSYWVIRSGSPWLSPSSPSLASPFACTLTPFSVGKTPKGAFPGSGTFPGLANNGEVSVGSWSSIVGSVHLFRSVLRSFCAYAICSGSTKSLKAVRRCAIHDYYETFLTSRSKFLSPRLPYSLISLSAGYDPETESTIFH